MAKSPRRSHALRLIAVAEKSALFQYIIPNLQKFLTSGAKTYHFRSQIELREIPLKRTIFGFAAFVKLWGLKPGARVSLLKQRKFSSGGFDPHKALKNAASAISNGDTDFDGLRSSVASWGQKTHAERNALCFDTFLNWIELSGSKLTTPPSEERIALSPQNTIGIRIRPEIAFYHRGAHYVAHLWASKEPPLDPTMLGMAFDLIRKNAVAERFAGSLAAVLDLAHGRLHTELHLKQSRQINSELFLAEIEKLWMNLRRDSRKEHFGDSFPLVLGA